MNDGFVLAATFLFGMFGGAGIILILVGLGVIP